jgi:hypothetical protein
MQFFISVKWIELRGIRQEYNKKLTKFIADFLSRLFMYQTHKTYSHKKIQQNVTVN